MNRQTTPLMSRRRTSPPFSPSSRAESAIVDVATAQLSVFELAAQLIWALEQGHEGARDQVGVLVTRYNELFGHEHHLHLEGKMDDGDAPPGAARRKVPEVIPQQTSQEVRSLAVALSDGRALSHWEEVLGEVALRHAVPGEPFQIKFMPSAQLIGWMQGKFSGEALRAQLRDCDLDTVLLLYEVLGMAVWHMERGESASVTMELDELINAIGWGKAARRSSDERNRLRLRVWHWLLIFDSLQVIGHRPGHYRDPGTGRILDLRSEDALLRVMGQRTTNNLSAPVVPTAVPTVPSEVNISPGLWIERHRGNRQILSEFGNVRILARLPSGKAGGAWARCIGMTLLQRWRERAARFGPFKTELSKAPLLKAEVKEAFAPRRGRRPKLQTGQRMLATPLTLPLTFSPPPFHPCESAASGCYRFTRRALLMGLFRAQPDVEQILKSNDPARARDYWDQAIEMLQSAGFLSLYREVEAPIPKRQGWQMEWLDAPVDLVPGLEPLIAAYYIRQRSHLPVLLPRARKTRGRPRKQRC